MKMLDPEARRAALVLLRRGAIRPAEVAALACVSLQVVNYWIRRAGIDWHRVYETRLRDAWLKEIKRGAQLVETAKARAGRPCAAHGGRGQSHRRRTRAAAEPADQGRNAR